MHELKRTCEMVMKEIDGITEKGSMSTQSVELLYKLMDILKDIKTVEAMEDEYGDGYSNDGDYSGARRGQHYVRGHYSRDDGMGGMNGSSNRGYSRRDYADERYSRAKMDYRNSRAGKGDVMDSLNEKMRELKTELQEMSRDSDFPEERERIDKYISMIDKVM